MILVIIKKSWVKHGNMPVIRELWRLRQQDFEFKSNLQSKILSQKKRGRRDGLNDDYALEEMMFSPFDGL